MVGLDCHLNPLGADCFVHAAIPIPTVLGGDCRCLSWFALCVVMHARKKRGWLYGMEMDSYKSRISDSILMVLVPNQNRTSPCLKSYGPCLIFFCTKCTHSRVPGLKGGSPFFGTSQFFSYVCRS